MWSKRKLSQMLLLASVAAVGACAHPNELANGDIDQSAPIGVRVENQNFNDVDVYAVSGGMARRLGWVTGNTAGTFSLEPSYAFQPISIVARPIGGFGLASSGQLNVSAGDTIELRVGSRLSQTSVMIR